MDRLYGVVERLILVVVVVVVEGVEREADGGAVARPPTACWERELEPGTELEGSTEGHNTLFSPLNPSVTCHTLVMDVKERLWRKERRKKWKKRAVRRILGFFFSDCDR